MPSPDVTLYLHRGEEKPIRAGMPWVYARQFTASSAQLVAPPGALAQLCTHQGAPVAVATLNVHAPIAARVLALGTPLIDAGFFHHKLQAALTKRAPHFTTPYYRLVHAEADGLPGLVIDRFGDTYVAQLGTAGMERLWPEILAALDALLAPKAILLRNDSAARTLEGLPQEVRAVRGEIPPLIEVVEDGRIYFADLWKGQKTGWFFDQAVNHTLIGRRAKGLHVLDVFSHSGGFGIAAARGDAASVTMVDSSALALDLAMHAAARNRVAELCATRKGDAFAVMQALADEGMRYELVIADPPAFVKTRKDKASGLKGYGKVARLAAALVTPGGELYVASCSHHASPREFERAVLEGVAQAGRSARVVLRTGASPDHPIHPHLPQTEYLKGVLLEVG